MGHKSTKLCQSSLQTIKQSQKLLNKHSNIARDTPPVYRVGKKLSLLDLLRTGHQAGKHSETHLGIWLHKIIGQGVHTCTNLS